MNAELQRRLDQIEGRITDHDFLSSRGIGNEIACYIFDYPAEDELQVRAHFGHLRARLKSHHDNLDVLHLDLFDVAIEYLKGRRLLDKALAMQKSKGDAGLVRMLEGPLKAERIRDFIHDQYPLDQKDLILVTGVGSVWPVLRSHALLNCLHSVIGETPLVLFYPGEFDGTALHLFGRPNSDQASASARPYYRAFSLIQ